MADPVIKVENLTKEYCLGVINHGTLRQDLQSWWARLRGLEDPNSLLTTANHTATDKRFLALDDVSFEVAQGEILGIIGRNGAGKSTLLKILSRITAPTSGRVRLKGRLASLLEVGTGFHPELTGGENVYLNGAIHGMKREEIRRKFDEIVSFAEVEKFIDTPVKRYSSGMYVRLAFAVAAHLEPEILIVDEVLAVGDAQFQKKCLGKMEEVGREGRTVLFVSHQLGAVRQLCTSGILLSNGALDFHGDVESTIGMYLQKIQQEQSDSGEEYLALNDDLGIVLESFRLLRPDGVPTVAAETGSAVVLEFAFSSQRAYERCLMAITVDSADDVRVCAFHNAISGFEMAIRSPRTIVRCTIPKVPLTPGIYRLTFKLKIADRIVFYLPKVFEFPVEDGDYFGTGRLPESSWGGICLVEHGWETESASDFIVSNL